MAIEQPKLIIWDFDGVISDTEHLWIKNWMILLNQKFGLNWDFEKANSILGGISPKTKIENLSLMGIQINDDFLDELKELDWQMMKSIELVEGVEDIFQLGEFAQCIATGGNRDKTERKLNILNLEKYFPQDRVFTAQQVAKGKPEPDLFLFAAKQMGYNPEQSIVIEDSLPGLEAGLRAGMETIAYLGCEMNNNPNTLQKVKDLGIQQIYFTMKELNFFLQKKLK